LSVRETDSPPGQSPSDIFPIPCSVRNRVRIGVSEVRVSRVSIRVSVRVRVRFMVWVRNSE